MSTHSMIFLQMGEDKYRGTYCHMDGYPVYVGVLLYTFYDTPEKIKELLSLGELSSLGARIGTAVDFQKRWVSKEYYNQTRGQCIAYHRDRGDPMVMPCLVKRKEELDREEYNYAFVNGKWWLITSSVHMPLVQVIASIVARGGADSVIHSLQDGLTPEEHATLVTKIKALNAMPANYLVLEQKGSEYKVQHVKTGRIETMASAEIERLMDDKYQVVRRKWGKGTRRFTV